MTEQNYDDRHDGPASGGSWGDPHPDSTQVVHSTSEHDEQTTTLSPTPPYQPTGRDEPGPAAGDGGSQWQPEYPAQSTYGSQSAMTSVYPASTPGYAPSGYPAAYAPPVAVPAPVAAVVMASPSSRVGPAFLSILIGLLLSAGGVYLAAKFGVTAATDIQAGKVGLKNSGLAALGAVLLFAAVGLNGWSPWSTIIPGIALTGIGGWTLFSVAGQARVAGWVRSVVPEFSAWTITGFSLVLGLVMLGASIAVALARASGKKDGQIIGFRQV